MREFKVQTSGQFLMPWALQGVDSRGEFAVSQAELAQANRVWGPLFRAQRRARALRALKRKAGVKCSQ